jgi:hypothetical protein
MLSAIEMDLEIYAWRKMVYADPLMGFHEPRRNRTWKDHVSKELSTEKARRDKKTRGAAAFRAVSRVTAPLIAEHDAEPFGIEKFIIENAKNGMKLIWSNICVTSRPHRNILGTGRADFERRGLALGMVSEMKQGQARLCDRMVPKGSGRRKLRRGYAPYSSATLVL